MNLDGADYPNLEGESMRISMDGDDQFLVGILAEILCKIEGRIFVSEQLVRDLPQGATIHIWYDEIKRGWWVSLDTPDASNGTGPVEPSNSVHSVSSGSSAEG